MRLYARVQRIVVHIVPIVVQLEIVHPARHLRRRGQRLRVPPTKTRTSSRTALHCATLHQRPRYVRAVLRRMVHSTTRTCSLRRVLLCCMCWLWSSPNGAMLRPGLSCRRLRESLGLLRNGPRPDVGGLLVHCAVLQAHRLLRPCVLKKMPLLLLLLLLRRLRGAWLRRVRRRPLCACSGRGRLRGRLGCSPLRFALLHGVVAVYNWSGVYRSCTGSIVWP